MISMRSALESCSNCSRVMAATPNVMVSVIGWPGCLDLACGEELRKMRMCKARRIERQNLACATRRVSGRSGQGESYQQSTSDPYTSYRPCRPGASIALPGPLKRIRSALTVACGCASRARLDQLRQGLQSSVAAAGADFRRAPLPKNKDPVAAAATLCRGCRPIRPRHQPHPIDMGNPGLELHPASCLDRCEPAVG